MIDDPESDTDLEFVKFALGEFGDDLRGVARYWSESYELSHLRPDLDGTGCHELELHRIAIHHRESEATPAADASVHVSDDAAVFHFAHGSLSGTVVSLDPHTAVEPSLVRVCSDLLEGNLR